MRLLLLLLSALLLFAQAPGLPPYTGEHGQHPPGDVRLPNGKLQRDEIAKAEYQKSLEDAGQLITLSQELKTDLEKDTEYVVNVSTLKKTEEIEKLAKRIRARLKNRS